MIYRVILVLLMLMIGDTFAFSATEKIKIETNDFVTGIFRSRGGIFYCGTFDNGIFRSTNNGNTWTHHASPADPVPIECASRIQTNDDKYVVVFVYQIGHSEYSLYSSVDSCKSWRPIIPGYRSEFEATKAVLLKNNQTVVLNAKNQFVMLDSGAASTKPIELSNTNTAKPIDFCVSKDDKIFILLDDGSISKIENSDFSHPEIVPVAMPQGERPLKISLTEKENFFVYTTKFHCYLLSTSKQPELIPISTGEENPKYFFELASANEDFFAVRINNYLLDFNTFTTSYYRKSTKSHDPFYESTTGYYNTTYDFYFSPDCMYLNVWELSPDYSNQVIYIVPFGTQTDVRSDLCRATDAGITLNSEINPTRIEILGQVLPTLPELSVYDELGNRLGSAGVFSSVSNSTIGIDTDCLPSGVYFVGVQLNGKRLLKRFIKI